MLTGKSSNIRTFWDLCSFRKIISRGTFLEILEYNISCPRTIRHTEINPTNRSVENIIAHVVLQQTQQTGALKNIEDTKLTETSPNIREYLGFVLSFEASLLKNCWRDNTKRDSFGKLRVQ